MHTSPALRYIDRPEEQTASFELMRELRPHLADPAGYAAQLTRQAEHGYRLLGAFQNHRVVGLVGFREMENLIYGRFVYVDDLIVDQSQRHNGLGATLLQAARDYAQQQGCAHLVLDTGSHMSLAQRFYFREGLLARGMHFVQVLQTSQETIHA
jgi:GNAT superfamily N-acetyltransferase